MTLVSEIITALQTAGVETTGSDVYRWGGTNSATATDNAKFTPIGTLALLTDDAVTSEVWQTAVTAASAGAKQITGHFSKGSASKTNLSVREVGMSPFGGRLEITWASDGTATAKASTTWGGTVTEFTRVNANNAGDPVYRAIFQTTTSITAGTWLLSIFPAATAASSTGTVYAGAFSLGSGLSHASSGATTLSTAWRVVARDFQPGSIGGSTWARQICVTPTGGFNQEYAEALTYPTFQVRVRAASTSSTGLEAKAEAVVTALNLSGRSTAPGRTYIDILQQGDLLYLGRDEAQRPMYAANFMALRSRTT